MANKKPLLERPEDFERAFLRMWSEEGVERLFELGVYADNIRDEKEMVRNVCVYLLDLPLNACEAIMRGVPELVPDSWEFCEMRRHLEEKYGEAADKNPLKFLPFALVNEVLKAYNKGVR
jgi:hypothetical protein